MNPQLKAFRQAIKIVKAFQASTSAVQALVLASFNQTKVKVEKTTTPKPRPTQTSVPEGLKTFIQAVADVGMDKASRREIVSRLNITGMRWAHIRKEAVDRGLLRQFGTRRTATYQVTPRGKAILRTTVAYALAQ